MAMTGGTAKLVKTGYANGSSNYPIKLYVYHKSTQTTSTNKSKVYVGMYVTSPSSSYDIGPWDDFNGSYVGTKSLTFDGTIPNFAGTRWIAENLSFDVTHDDEGKGKATIYWKWGVNSSWGGFVNPSGSFEITLPTIARASVPTCASSVTMGNSLTITTNRKSSSFTHTLSYKFGSKTGTIATGVGASKAWTVPDLAAYCNNATKGTCTITCDTYSGSTKIGSKTVTVTLNVPEASVPTVSASTVAMGNKLTISTNRKSSNFTHQIAYSFNGYSELLISGATKSYAWEVPLDLASKIPSAPSGTGIITCITFNGTATVGTETVPFTASVPNNTTTQPKLSSYTLTPDGTVPSAFSGLYIQGKTGLKATFTASSKYSTISSYKMTIGSITRSGNPATLTSFSTAGAKTVICTITDARGYYTTFSPSITVLPYSTPKVVPYSGAKSIVCERCTSDGTLSDSGTWLRIKAGRSYSTVTSNGAQKNFCTFGYRYKVSDASAYSSDVVLISSSNTTIDEVDTKISGIVSSITTSYSVQLFVRDTMGEEETYTVPVPTAGADFHLMEGGAGAAFGKYAEIKNGVEFAWDVYGRARGLGNLKVIRDNSDYDDYKEPGSFAVTSNASAKTMSNRPCDEAGTLTVYSSNGVYNADSSYKYIVQEYTTYTGRERYRRYWYTSGGPNAWNNAYWEVMSADTGWVSLGLSSAVSAPSTSHGIVGSGCYYRVIDKKHVYVAFNCSVSYTGGDVIVVSGLTIPTDYRPTRYVYSICAAQNRHIARIYVNTAGEVCVNYLQSMQSGTQTTSSTVGWLDGYMDYWI